MLKLADIDAAIAAADARRSRRVREAESDYQAEIALALALRRPLVAEARALEAIETTGWLTFAQIAARRPAGRSRDARAVRQAVRDRLRKWPGPVPTREMPGREKAFSTEWLTAAGLIF